MITETQIIEAAKEIWTEEEVENFLECRDALKELTLFAQHWYRKGLLDAAEKCDKFLGADYYPIQWQCAEALRNMAESCFTETTLNEVKEVRK